MSATKPAATPVLTKIVPDGLIDEWGDLTKLRDEFAPTERRYQKCREQLKALVESEDPEAQFKVRGERYVVEISPCSMESKPDVPAVRKRLGAAMFLHVVAVTKKALEGVLLKHEIEELCISTRTGSRSYAPTAISKT